MTKKLRNFIIIGFIIILSSILIISKFSNKSRRFKDISILDYVKVKYSESPIIIHIIDTRSELAVNVINAVSDYIIDNNLKINVGIIISNKKTINFRGNYKLYNKEEFGNVKFLKNSYYIFNKYGRFVRRGSLLTYPKSIFFEIDILFGIQNSYTIDEDLKLYKNINNSSFNKTVNTTYRDTKFTCYIVFNDICLGCRSGKSLTEFDKLQILCPKLKFNYITVFNYTENDVKRFKKNNNIKINILLADSKLKKRWIEIESKTNKTHPLEGIIFVVDQNGIIKLITKEWDKYYRWLGSL